MSSGEKNVLDQPGKALKPKILSGVLGKAMAGADVQELLDSFDLVRMGVIHIWLACSREGDSARAGAPEVSPVCPSVYCGLMLMALWSA